MKSILSFAVSLCISFSCYAQTNYAEDIAPIIYKNCSNCHRPGEIGPFPLTNYEEVSNWAPTIKFVTEIGYMPPWKPDTEYSSFIGESNLEQEEIDMIADWVDNGMERGDPAVEPAFPDYPEGSLLGVPDMVLTMEEAHLHRGNNRDSYYYFVLPTDLPEDEIIKAVEFRPGNTKIVHHALIFEDTNNIARATDAQTPEYGFESFGSFNGNQNDVEFLNEKQFPPYAPGQKAIRYPEGLGQVLKAGADIAVQVHYAPSASDEWDQSTINFFFADTEEEIDRYVDQNIFLPFQLPGGFFGFVIPANQTREFLGQWRVTSDLSLMGIFPHSHLLGTEWEAWLEHTDGTRTNLISIPDWDFNWQAQYYFDRLIKAEAGSTIYARAVYDNTSSNPNNPNFPPELVFWGDGTEDEMFYMPFLHVPYRIGDENIRYTEGTTSIENIEAIEGNYLQNLSPNPVSDYVTVDFHLATGTTLDINIYSMNGRLIRKLRSGEYFHTGDHKIFFKSEAFESGTYILNIDGNNVKLSQKFVKAN